MGSLAGDEFAPRTTYLNTASAGLGPARAASAIQRAVQGWPIGDFSAYDLALTAARASFARIAGVPVERVAAGSSVSVYAGLIAAGLPAGSEVLVAEGDFSSLVNPFAVRADLKLRTVPLENVADEIGAGTALVAVSSVQSADGRIADLDAIRTAAAACGTRVLIDATQSAGWLPLRAGDFDYVVCAAFKWLLSPRGVCFLAIGESTAAELPPAFAGWLAGEDPWLSCYGPVADLAASARRFDHSPAYLSYIGAAESLALIEETGIETIRAHNVALADRFAAGLASLGYEPVETGGSAIVSVPGLGGAAEELERAGIQASARAGNLRASFHLYNSAQDVHRILDALPAHRP
ncbi:aminotransferase class V-fold PLP-dependent enzyme [Streptomyces ferralitis]|uniref:Aminotransferase class V-fold PLP-dependent enzyme n=1 Tax=Streptantibioticus ferralitis TaxID=236510 RepID=A0ABT5Z296_9ACTN|nr:aminotransferase class V-fold PLP-dependent enzyme [Streptantibioticus ferralitis]MDF2257965.1 aminotransferase class V-fold PLP-dependent enzyme [Streptantibioticus ferralitis]